MDFYVNFLEITSNAKRGASGVGSVEAGCCVAIEFRTKGLRYPTPRSILSVEN